MAKLSVTLPRWRTLERVFHTAVSQAPLVFLFAATLLWIWTVLSACSKYTHPSVVFKCYTGLYKEVLIAIAVFLILAALSYWFVPVYYDPPTAYVMGQWEREPKEYQETKELKYEAYRQEHPWIQLTPPTWQVSLWAEANGVHTLVGHANRMANHLVANWHVLESAPLDTLYIKILRVNKPVIQLRANQLTWVTVVGDIAAASLDAAKIHLPGVTNAPVKHVVGKEAVQVGTDYPAMNASNGMVSNHPDLWGMLLFNGSTRPGFSGSSYFSGKSMYGIHTYGGVENVGYSASYIMQCLKKRESSDYLALRHMLDGAEDLDYVSRPSGDPDEIEVRYQGRYFIVEREEFQELATDYPLEHYESGSRRVRRQYENAKVPAKFPKPPHMPPIQVEVDLEDSLTESTGSVVSGSMHTVDYCVACGEIEVDYSGEKCSECYLAQRIERLVEKAVQRALAQQAAQYESARVPAELPPPPTLEQLEEMDMVERFDRLRDLNCQRAPLMVGSPAQCAQDTLCRPLDPLPGLCTVALEPTISDISGQWSPENRLIAVSVSTQTTPEKQMKSSSSQTPKSSSGSKYTTASVTPSDTQPDKRRRRRRKNIGERSSTGSIGRPAQASEPSRPMGPISRPLAGTGSDARKKPTTRGSSTWYPSASRPSRRAVEESVSAVAVVAPVRQI
ncbi:hypothetical protein 1 [Amygdalus persica sobemo-like virus]|nr:hypothetical protein 1 [Amygdalus persica sobemo-like virus]